MNILNLEHISKLFGDKMIFDDASFGVQEGDKIGIIGINGTGKSTLLRMIAGEEEPDGGQIVRQNGLKIAYLSQSPVFEPDIYEAISMKTCVEKRTTIGAPGRKAMEQVIEIYRKRLG